MFFHLRPLLLALLSLSPPRSLSGRTCSALFFSNFVEEKT
jgi:hypothetical protein